MPDWKFDERPANLVEQEPTQRDQFNNDDVTLGQAVVREVIQNSTDAASNGGPVRVRFDIREIAPGQVAAFRALFLNLRPHLQACGIDPAVINQGSPRVLVIEDFNTRGLTGDPGALDGQNFHNFWRRHGKSEKTGRAGGRWGLGKLVYSSASDIKAFFGLTVRENDPRPLLMGQAVLASHELSSKRFTAHGFWFDHRNAEQMQLPVTDLHQIDTFAAMAGITRTDQPGLSIIIPYLNQNIDTAVLTKGIIENYYFPILAGRLVIEIAGAVIDRENFLALARRISGSGAAAFLFVEQVSQLLRQEPAFRATRPLGDENIAGLFEPDVLSQMKAAYSHGELVHARIPVRLRPKIGAEVDSSINLFLKALPENASSFGLFARGSITVPGEKRYFGGAHAFGAMVATDDPVVTFLGDAENPAHTGWNGNAEKLHGRWRNPGATLRAIRHSMRLLYDALADEGDREDRDALIDFFSLVDPARSPDGKAKRTPVKPNPPPPAEKAIRIRPAEGGFAIVPGPGAEKWTFPKAVRVRVAYDRIGGNPFKKHSRHDFDLTGKAIAVETENMTCKPALPNVFVLSLKGPDFRLEASGFDRNRDLVVDARAMS